MSPSFLPYSVSGQEKESSPSKPNPGVDGISEQGKGFSPTKRILESDGVLQAGNDCFTLLPAQERIQEDRLWQMTDFSSIHI